MTLTEKLKQAYQNNRTDLTKGTPPVSEGFFECLEPRGSGITEKVLGGVRALSYLFEYERYLGDNSVNPRLKAIENLLASSLLALRIEPAAYSDLPENAGLIPQLGKRVAQGIFEGPVTSMLFCSQGDHLLYEEGMLEVSEDYEKPHKGKRRHNNDDDYNIDFSSEAKATNAELARLRTALYNHQQSAHRGNFGHSCHTCITLQQGIIANQENLQSLLSRRR